MTDDDSDCDGYYRYILEYFCTDYLEIQWPTHSWAYHRSGRTIRIRMDTQYIATAAIGNNGMITIHNLYNQINTWML